MIARFIDYISYEKRYSPHTVLAYKTDLEQFIRFLEEQYGISQPEEITYLVIRDYLSGLMESGLNARSVNRKKTCMQTYFRYLIREGLITVNPMKRVISPKSAKRLPVYIPEGQTETLFLEAEAGSGESFIALRNRMILEMFYATGMRLSELVHLKDSDLDLSSMTVRVLGKRNKERLIPFGPSLAKLIRQYLDCRSAEHINNVESRFFVTGAGKKIYPKLAYRVVNDYLSSIPNLEKKSPHVLRHTFATHMLNKGAELNAIKELLGHASLSATQVYTHNTIEKLKTIYKQAHPKA